MKILLANPRGFCAGVIMAIKTVEQTIQTLGTPLYVYHEIVHNKHVVDNFKSRGVTFIDDINLVPENATLIFSAHGTSPHIKQLAQQRNCAIIDATCPLVTKVHTQATHYAKQGYNILLIGHKGHDEILGTLGHAPKAITVIQTTNDIYSLNFTQNDKLIYLTQTTLNRHDANNIIDAIKNRYPNLKSPPSADICYATTNRQQAVAILAPKTDLAIVVGSANSSNSQRLAEIARSANIPTHLIDDVTQLDLTWLNNVNTLLLTAGASAPQYLVTQIIRHLKIYHNITIHEKPTAEEHTHFPLPSTLLQLQNKLTQ